VRSAILLAVALTLTACPSAPVASPPPEPAEPVEPAPAVVIPDPPPPDAASPPAPVSAVVDDPATVVPSTKLAEPIQMKLKGTYVHAGSGMSFPAAAATFSRVMPQQYDREGNDVGIGYVRSWLAKGGGFTAVTTIYVYPAQRRPDGTVVAFDEQFQGEVNSTREQWSDPTELGRVDTDAEDGGRPVRVRAAEFSSRGVPENRNVPTVTIVAAYRRGPWHVTYRVTVPAAHRDVCLAGFEKLLEALGLPPTGLRANTQ
jgi:hypothetical protein